MDIMTPIAATVGATGAGTAAGSAIPAMAAAPVTGAAAPIAGAAATGKGLADVLGAASSAATLGTQVRNLLTPSMQPSNPAPPPLPQGGGSSGYVPTAFRLSQAINQYKRL